MTKTDALFRIVKVMLVPMLAIITLYALYALAPAPFTPELISPMNNSSIEITPHTQLLWSGGIQDSLLSKIISVIRREPIGNTRITYNIYFGERSDNTLTFEKDISNFRAKPNTKEQIRCSFPDYITENSTYCWKIIAISDLGKETESPIWIFNTTTINLPPTIDDLTPEPASPQAPGAIITWTANASDPNNDPIYYKFLLNGVEQTPQWTLSNKWNWITSEFDSGTNSITVLIRDGKHAYGDYFDSDPIIEWINGAKHSYENSSDDWKNEKFVISAKHKILEIESSKEFSITNIWDKNNKPLNKNDEFFYSERGEAAPISVRGDSQYGGGARIWVVLTDIYNNYYLQNPPIFINPTGSWRATNIRPLEDIILISFIKVEENGDAFFTEKVNRSEWFGFQNLPSNSKIVGSIEIL